MDNLVAKKRKLGWTKQLVSLEIVPAVEEKSNLVLLGKILLTKIFSRLVVKEIVVKEWNTVNVAEVIALDKDIFSFTFAHEVDVRRAKLYTLVAVQSL